MKNPITILPTECFRRFDSSLQLNEVADRLGHAPVRMVTGIWLTASPATGYPAPMNSAHIGRANRRWPGKVINGQYFTWVGLDANTKCLVSYAPVIPDNAIPLFSPQELIEVQNALQLESAELRMTYGDLDFSKASTWTGLRDVKGEERDVEYREWLTTRELSFIVWGPQHRVSTKNINRRVTIVRNLANELGLAEKHDDRYRITSSCINILKVEARKRYDSQR